jgi:uncharacterized protein YbbC (DUF1343 family)
MECSLLFRIKILELKKRRMRDFSIFIACLLFFNISCAEKRVNDAPAHHESFADNPVKVGAERMELYLPSLVGKKVAVCGNQTSKVGHVHLVDTLLASGVEIVKIFCPEHGFRGEAEAGATISSSVDQKTGIPIISLYGNSKKPATAQMSGIDILLFDIQDVGCRFYTYISTLHYVMESTAENGVQLYILDRPNPNGYFMDGPVLNLKYQSFVGMHPVPVVHGMTIAEYAQMINGEKWLKNGVQCKLQIIPIENWNHTLRYPLPCPPSPNLPTEEAVYLYPSLCFFEGTAISIGRGTALPFQIYGHPAFKDGDFIFTPQPVKGIAENPPLKGVACRGYNLVDWAHSQLNAENKIHLSFLLNARQQMPQGEPLFTNPDFFDKLAGNSILREQIQNGLSEDSIRNSWLSDLRIFKTKRTKYLLYPDFE